MQSNNELDNISRLVADHRLGEAMELLDSFGCKYPELSLGAALYEIRADYERMVEYWRKGYKDPRLDDIYNRLLRRMYRLTADVRTRYATTHSRFWAGIGRKASGAGRDWSLPVLRQALEGFVSDVAMLEFEPENTRRQKRATLYANHQKLMDELFDHICASPQWSDGTADAYEQMLISPTVDTNDQQLIVSALMIATMNMFDICKFRVLVSVYMKSSDENVRQRALVGWVLSLGRGHYGLFPEQRQMVGDMLAREDIRAELTELQIQILYCISTESDNKKIQNEIMPDLLKHNNLHITRHGIEEKTEDPMQDILDPEASERNMEKVEESFRKMVDMQKAGSDIYFGGFSQMKRFPFFDSICNWFVPFYPEHPEISSIYDKMSGSKFINMMMSKGPFCDSDKYSFIMAFRQVMDRIPQNMRELLNNGEGTWTMGELANTDMRTAAYIRRTYLQDIYRFFRLFPAREQFYNPFNYRKPEKWEADYIFFSNPIFNSTPLEERFGELGAFMMKRGLTCEAAELLENYSDNSKDYQYYMLRGNILLRQGETIHTYQTGPTAAECFDNALKLKREDNRALLGYARAQFYDGNYTEAKDAYERLMEAKPDNKNYQLGYCVCLTNLEMYDEAMKVLYRLHYEDSENDSVARVLARALLGDGKYEQADKIYMKLLEKGTLDDNDLLNRGYGAWFASDRDTAANYFAGYLKKRYPNSSQSTYREKAEADIVDTEREFILHHGVSSTEIQLMLDLTCDAILR